MPIVPLFLTVLIAQYLEILEQWFNERVYAHLQTAAKGHELV